MQLFIWNILYFYCSYLKHLWKDEKAKDFSSQAEIELDTETGKMKIVLLVLSEALF